MRLLNLSMMLLICTIGVSMNDCRAGGVAATTNEATVAWKVGDSWKVVVESYAAIPELGSKSGNQQKRQAEVFATYPMVIRVAGSIPFSNSVCWVLDFVPGIEAPASVQEQQYRVFVGPDGGMRKVERRSKGAAPVSIESFGDLVFVRHMTPGFPIQCIPTTANTAALQQRGQSRSLVLSTALGSQERVIEGSLEKSRRDGTSEKDFVVRQSWRPGAKWWTTYLSYAHGEIHTRAWLESATPPEITPAVGAQEK